MPTYEYQCLDCEHRFEVTQRMTDDRLTTCPQCNKETLEKLISAVNFQLKGTGWYETDFKNKGKEDADKAKSKKDGKSSSESSGKANDKAEKTTSSGNDSSKNSDTKSKSDSAAQAGSSTKSTSTSD